MLSFRKNQYLFAGLGVLLFVPLMLVVVSRRLGDLCNSDEFKR